MSNEIVTLLSDESFLLKKYREAKSRGYSTLEVFVQQGKMTLLTLKEKYKPDPEPTKS